MSRRLPLFPLGTVLFPGAGLPLHVFEPRYRQLVRDLLERPEPRTFAVIAIREGREVGADGVRALYEVGCITRVTDVRPQPDGRFALLTVGTQRFRLGEVDHSLEYAQADVELLDEPLGSTDGIDELAAAVRATFVDYATALAKREVTAVMAMPDDPTVLSYAVAAAVPLDLRTRQALLEAPDTAARLAAERELLTRELALLRHLGAAPLRDTVHVPRNLN